MMLSSDDLKRIGIIFHKESARLLFVSLSSIAVFLMGGCASLDVMETRNLDVTEKPYQRALFLQYSELALREIEEGNVSSAGIFNSKAKLAAAEGNISFPVYDETTLSDARAEVLQAAQRVLQGYLDQEADLELPVVTARAHAMLDCWIEEEEQGVDIGDIAACRQAFKRAIAVLETRFPAK